MVRVWCIRADGGKYAQRFLDGGYAGIEWLAVPDLSGVQSREEVQDMLWKAYPALRNTGRIRNHQGQIAAFILDIKPGDYVITPPANTEWLHYGRVPADGTYYYAPNAADGCPYPHRWNVDWAEPRIRRSELSIPFQQTVRAMKTVFSVSHVEEFLSRVGAGASISKARPTAADPYRVVLDQILELAPGEFEELVESLLAALGFEETEVTGKTGDGGVDVMGELDLAGLAKVKLFVQAKRYKQGTRVSAKTVREFRGSIPRDGQGALITTASYPAKAREIAVEPGFPRIGLIDGRQLVDLLVDRWDSIPEEFREKLGLRRGLVR